MAPKKTSTGDPAASNDVAKADIEKKYACEKERKKITPTFLVPYPEPKEVKNQIVNLEDLDDPPENFQLEDLSSREPVMPNSVSLMRYHFWNINPGRVSNGPGRLNAFRKLIWNQDEQHRPPSLFEFTDLNRDAGPRLLKPEILHRLNIMPISRHYPDCPQGTDWEEQRTRPTRPVATSKENNNDPDPDDDASDSLIQEEIPPHLDIVRETLERLLIRLRYQDLEIPRSDSNGEQAHTLVHVPESSYKKYSSPQKVKLFLDTNHNVDPSIEGMQYLFHERGPVGDVGDGSRTGFDCILMAGKLLDVGLTKIDMEEFSPSGIQETSAHQMFVAMIKADWTFTSIEQNKKMRNALHHFCQGLTPADFTDLLNKITILRKQFIYKYTELLLCEQNHENLISQEKSALACLENGYEPSQYTGLSMKEVLQLIFSQQGPTPPPRASGNEIVCNAKACKKGINQRTFRRTMPLRLAVSLPSDVSPQDHTSDDIRIDTFNEEGKEEIAVYRWLGGIYSDTETESEHTHYRVYWTDAIRGEKPTKNIRMYDPRYAQGRVIEGIAPSQNGQIPDTWWQGKRKPVLFYERVLDPNTLDVTLAAAVLGDIHHAIINDLFILKVHEPWKHMSPQSNSAHSNDREVEDDKHDSEDEDMGEGASAQGDSQHGDDQAVDAPQIDSSMLPNQEQFSVPQMPNIDQFSGEEFLNSGEYGDSFINDLVAALPRSNGLPEFPELTPQNSQLSRNGNSNQNIPARQLNPAASHITQMGPVNDIPLNMNQGHHFLPPHPEPPRTPENRAYNRGGLHESMQDMHLEAQNTHGPFHQDITNNDYLPDHVIGNNSTASQEAWNSNFMNIGHPPQPAKATTSPSHDYDNIAFGQGASQLSPTTRLLVANGFGNIQHLPPTSPLLSRHNPYGHSLGFDTTAGPSLTGQANSNHDIYITHPFSAFGDFQDSLQPNQQHPDASNKRRRGPRSPQQANKRPRMGPRL